MCGRQDFVKSEMALTPIGLNDAFVYNAIKPTNTKHITGISA